MKARLGRTGGWMLLVGIILTGGAYQVGFSQITPTQAQATPSIQAVTPLPPGCVLRNSDSPANRRLQFDGVNFSTTQHNLQFRKTVTGDTSIHFHMEINWESSTRFSVDMAAIKHLLWPDFQLRLNARLTDTNLQPVSGWSPDFILADDSLSCQAPGTVLPPPTRTINVYVMNFDPLFEGQPAHQRYGWNNPDSLTAQYMADVAELSGGKIQYNLVRQSNIRTYPIKPGGYLFTDAAFQACLDNSGNAPHCLDIIDYQATLNTRYDPAYVSACQALSTGAVDEIWMWGAPWFGYWEYFGVGPGEPSCAGLRKQAWVMGFNYEVGAGFMLHDLSHRAEAAIPPGVGYALWDRFDGQRHRYQTAQNPSFPDVDPASTHCGNTHFTPNSNQHYLYNRNLVVQSDCLDWSNWPNLSGQKTAINYPTWDSAGGDYQRGYLKWWFGNLPRSQGFYNGIYANWWHYLHPLPAPSIQALTPASAAAGSPSLELVVDGQDFVTTSAILWKGQVRTTTFISRTRLSAAIPANDLTNPGTASVSVYNSPPGGGVAEARYFTIESAPGVPAAPSNLNAIGVSLNRINVSWNSNSGNEQGFRLEYRVGTGPNWLNLGDLPLGVTVYSHYPVMGGNSYYYRVRAFNQAGFSAYSNTDRAVPADYTVTNPTDLGAADQATPGTLSYALEQARTTAPGALPKIIAFDLTGGGNRVLLKGGLPPVQGAALLGWCDNGPGLLLDGSAAPSGLQLNGQSSLYGLELTGFKTLPLQVKSGDNRLGCVKVSR